MESSGAEWLFKCPACGALRSSLTPAIRRVEGRQPILNERQRMVGLRSIRTSSYGRILDLIVHKAPGPRLLDVGCSHGWFLDEARYRGFRTFGIEPDWQVAHTARSKGHAVCVGFFPDALAPSARFDVVCFNDVLEHIPDLRGALEATAGILSRDGLLVLSIPNRDGALYRLATGLAAIGVPGPLKRMWQYGFPSPHVHYLRPDHTAQVAGGLGLSETACIHLPGVRASGLWARIRYDRGASTPVAVLAFVLILVLLPALRYLPKDTVLQLFRRGS